MKTADALDLARSGRIARGFLLLEAGLLRAQAASDAGEPWAQELERHWDEVLRRYVRRFSATERRAENDDGDRSAAGGSPGILAAASSRPPAATPAAKK